MGVSSGCAHIFFLVNPKVFRAIISITVMHKLRTIEFKNDRPDSTPFDDDEGDGIEGPHFNEVEHLASSEGGYDDGPFKLTANFSHDVGRLAG